ncbi:MAG: VOC family protein [Sandaracinaceae bacterium]|nr:VOC family protein [Sandaracinaceae bacterium]
MARVTGIGGIFFKTKSDPKEVAAWYAKHLGLALAPWGGAMLKWADDPGAADAVTVWHTAAHDTKWFEPGEASFMINYRVDDLEALLAKLREDGVTIVKGPQTDETGSFAWILDLDGNKVELWQPPPA